MSPVRVGATAVLLLMGVMLFIWPSSWGLNFAWGDPLGEADNHLWMFWSMVQDGDLPVGNAPSGNPIPLMDPVHLPVFWLGHEIGGPVLGWRFLVFFNLGLAMLGGYGLAQELAGPRGAWVGMVATAASPVMAGLLDFGMTESWTLGWLAIHAWMLIGFSRRGGLGRGLLAGASLGAIALSGWYHALYGLTLELMLVPLLLWQSRRPGLVLQGLIGLGMAWPAWTRFQEVRGVWEARWRMPPPGPPGPREDWAELPVFGTDLLNLFLPRLDTVSPSKCAYLSLVLVGLIGLGLMRDRSRTLLMVGLSLPFLLLALGPWPTIGGKAVGFPGPAYALVQIFPSMSGLTHWERAVGAAVPFLAAAGALGAASLPSRRGLIVIVCGLLLLDSVAFSSAPWPRNSYSIRAPEAIRTLPGEGGWIQIPFDNGREEFSQDPARLYSRWQLDHGHLISENYEGVDSVLESSELIRRVDTLCGLRQTIPPYYKVPRELSAELHLEGEALRRERGLLRGWGYQWIILHQDRCPRYLHVIQLLEPLLGPAQRRGEETRAWEL